MKPIIFAVEDDDSIRELYDCAFSDEFWVETFERAEPMFERLKEVLPELFLLDIMLDGIDGFAVLERLKEDVRTSEIPVVMISAKSEELTKVKGFRLGADDYMTKPFGILELVARVKAKLRKPEKHRVGQTVRLGDLTVDEGSRTATWNGRDLGLTGKEFRVLRTLAASFDRVVPRDTLMTEVWGDFVGESRSLDMHVKAVRRKLEKTSYEIVTVRGIGFKLTEVREDA